ncbi:MAG: HEAT repeat domain-containing protein, partial [Planctomycetales bacterium]
AAAAELASLDKPGVAVLIEAFEKEVIASAASKAFATVGPSALDALIVALAHEKPGVRAAAADAVGRIGPEARKAIPHLTRMFQDDDHDARLHAVRALDALGREAVPAVPDLIQVMLDSKQREPARQWAIMTLVNILPDARDAVVKALIQASRDKGNYGVSSLARQQLRKIDPKAAEAAGIR